MTICHATSSEKNPYVQLQVDDDSIVREGHGEHPGDIIPPFDYVEDGVTKQYPGKNWDAAGQAIFANGCEVPAAAAADPALGQMRRRQRLDLQGCLRIHEPERHGGHRRPVRERVLPCPR